MDLQGVSDRVRCRPFACAKGEIKRVGEQTEAITEYSETLVRRLIERITVYDEMLVVGFKSGLQVEVVT